MSTTTNDRLARLLDSPLLARVVPHLAPEVLHSLIERRGLDASVELVTSATPAQLASVLDLDLWRPAQPGRDDEFDVDRFGEWLEVLVDAGESVAARMVASLDKDLVVVGLSRYIRVFDPGTFEPTAPSDDEATDRHDKMNNQPSRGPFECEVGGYLVRALRPDAWDAIVGLLMTLETEHPDTFTAVMQGCRRLSDSAPEVDGLDNLLTAPAQHLHDAAVERDRRRSRQGYATAADARAFLQLARQSKHTPQTLATVAANPIATAYFRAADEDADAAPVAPPADARVGGDMPASTGAVIALLAEAGVMPDHPRALLEAGDADPGAAAIPLLRRLMKFVLRHDETAYLTRTREFAFLANTLIAGGSIQSRPFTPREAADAAACICNLGLERAAPADAFLVDHDLVSVFELGWSVLYEDVSLFATDQLVATLDRLQVADPDTRKGLRALRRALVKQRKAGTPWLARDAAEVLAILDLTAWTSVLGLLDDCPMLPAALTAMLERRTTSVSPTEFQFISSAAQIGDVRVFMSLLPGVLSD